MISKFRYITITVIMLVLLGFGFNNQSRAQVGLDGLFCPGIPNTTGWLMTEIVGFGSGFNTNIPDFTGSQIGTVENSGADAVAGLDWQHVDQLDRPGGKPTNEIGSQLVTWWTQKDGRNTYLQVTNSNSGGCLWCNTDGSVNVHVRIFNEDCIEVRDFCDVYTPSDTHEYNFGDLFANTGAPIGDGNLQGVEGWLVVTPVKDCGLDSEQPIDHDYMSGQLIVHDSDDYLYGVNTYARQGVCYNRDCEFDGNVFDDGNFEDGPASFDDPWNGVRGLNDALESANWIPPNEIPAGGTYMGVTASIGNNGNQALDNNLNCGVTGDANECGKWTSPQDRVATSGYSYFEQDITVDSCDLDGDITGNIQLYTKNCDGGIAVALYNGNLVLDNQCWYSNDQAQPEFNGTNCTAVETDGPDGAIDYQAFIEGQSVDFDQASFAFPFSIKGPTVANGAGTYKLVVMAAGFGGTDADCNVSAAVNDIFLQNKTTDECDGCLDGRDNAKLVEVTPDVLYGQFNLLPGNVQAGADVVHINFTDDYGVLGQGPYSPVAAFSKVFISIFDENEIDQSCGNAEVCFVRLGIDDPIVMSEDFSPATPTAPPTLTPTSPPPTLIPTPTPTPTGGGGGGSGSCAIAGSPVQLGTALANVLIPLVPVAFAFGVRAVRRRKK